MAGRGNERVGALASVGDRRLLHLVARLQGQEEFVLRVEEIGAIQRKERLPSLDRLAREIHIEITNPAFDLHVHVGLFRLVVPNNTCRAYILIDPFLPHGHGLHPDQLLPAWINRHISPRRRVGCAGRRRITGGRGGHRPLNDLRTRCVRPRTRAKDVDTRTDSEQQPADRETDQQRGLHRTPPSRGVTDAVVPWGKSAPTARSRSAVACSNSLSARTYASCASSSVRWLSITAWKSSRSV